MISAFRLSSVCSGINTLFVLCCKFLLSLTLYSPFGLILDPRLNYTHCLFMNMNEKRRVFHPRSEPSDIVIAEAGEFSSSAVELRNLYTRMNDAETLYQASGAHPVSAQVASHPVFRYLSRRTEHSPRFRTDRQYTVSGITAMSPFDGAEGGQLGERHEQHRTLARPCRSLEDTKSPTGTRGWRRDGSLQTIWNVPQLAISD